MPLLPTFGLFAAALALFAVGSPLGAVPLVIGVIGVSLKLGMPVVTDTQRRAHVPATRQPASAHDLVRR